MIIYQPWILCKKFILYRNLSKEINYTINVKFIESFHKLILF